MNTLPGLPELKPSTLYCIGRNYADHAKELNNPVPETPVMFTKPSSCIIHDNGTILLPPGAGEVHHEAELVIAIGKAGKHIIREQAIEYIAGLAAGIDVTDRATQTRLKEKGLPWLLAKGLDTFGPVGNFTPPGKPGQLEDIDVIMEVNGQIRQEGNTRDLLFPVTDLIVRLSALFTLQPGDLIFTGTPAGVGPLKDGDLATARIRHRGAELSSVTVNVAHS